MPNLNRPEDLPAEDDRQMPDNTALPEVSPVGMSRITAAPFVDTRPYEAYLRRPEPRSQYYYLMEISVKEFKQFSHLHDGSPASLLSIFMYRACLKPYPDNSKPIQGAILQNYRAALRIEHRHNKYIVFPEESLYYYPDRSTKRQQNRFTG